jgi:hypothetical protein
LRAAEKKLKAAEKREKMLIQKLIGEGKIEAVEVKPKRGKRVKTEKVEAVSVG